MNPLEVYDTVEIRRLFRFQRENILQLVDHLQGSLQYRTGRMHCLPPLLQVCITLRYYATGSMQLSLSAWMNVDQATVSRCIWRVTKALRESSSHLLAFNDVVPIKQLFFEKSKIPNLIGCIDCTHVRIPAPPNNLHPNEYINRKNYHSINVQAVCDYECVFLDVLAAWPGSVHDSRIFRNSSLFHRLATGALNGILLGDNGYAIFPFLLTPFLRPNNDIQGLFNTTHKKTRNVIERAFGQLKKRFHCLGSNLRVRLDRSCPVIMACFILHNFAKRLHDPDFEIDNNDVDHDLDYPFADDHADGYYRNLGNNKRLEIAHFLANQ
jgi:hypothetical protein